MRRELTDEDVRTARKDSGGVRCTLLIPDKSVIMVGKLEGSAEARAARRELTDEDIRTAIKNSGGVRGTLLIPDAPFELLVRRAIGRLLTPALQCKEFVHAELLRIAGQCAPPDIGRFPALQVSAGSSSALA